MVHVNLPLHSFVCRQSIKGFSALPRIIIFLGSMPFSACGSASQRIKSEWSISSTRPRRYFDGKKLICWYVCRLLGVLWSVRFNSGNGGGGERGGVGAPLRAPESFTLSAVSETH